MASLATLPADAEAILAEFAAALTAAGIELPDRQYVNPGNLVAWDEPQLTLAVVGVFMGEPGVGSSQSLVPGQFHQYVSFGLLYLQPVASLTDEGLPATDALNENGRSLLSLVSLFWTTAIELRVTGKLAEGNASVAIGPCTPVGPEGGLAGVGLAIEVSLV